ncbi:MAG: exo-alpha-sialidase [Rhodoferax sp.]|nr:exo-alpha-sialidase [Pseudorhodobacter sp.]
MSHVTILVGTTKGVFLIDGSSDRRNWSLRGPFCGGWPINHVVGDPKTGTIWAAGGDDWHGGGVWRSDDGGENWALTKLSNGQWDAMLTKDPAFAAHIGMAPSPPAPFTGDITAIWSLGQSGDTLYAGAKPATLYSSTDQGENWAKVQALSDHPSRDSWEPGAAGLVLHSIVTDPGNAANLWVGISAAGVFGTEDGGRSMDRRNRMSNTGQDHDHAHAAPQGEGGGHETGLCVHNIVRASAGASDLMYQQNHHGVFRSPDGGRSWDEMTDGLPSTFGFPIAVHPADPRTIWVFPLNGDTQGRFPPEASAAIWRSRTGGSAWERLQNGLPDKNCFFTVLRQALAVDKEKSAGVYFGTNSGSVFASADEGDSWAEVARHLPTILSVETLQRA